MRSLVMICICCLLLSACAKVPSQQSYPYSYQHKMQSADHWDNMAEKVVKEQVNPLFTDPKQNKPDSIIGVYVGNKDRSAFGMAFQTYLITELFNNSIPVTANPKDSYTIEWSVQKVIHESERRQPGPPGGILGAVVYFIGSLFGADFYDYGKVPHTELLVTTELVNNNIVYSRSTETLYINDVDTKNYWVLPDRGEGIAKTYVREGSTVCRNIAQLESALTPDDKELSQLQLFINEGKCAITKDNYPVTILSENEKYSVIKSLEEPYYIYVTPKESLGG